MYKSLEHALVSAFAIPHGKYNASALRPSVREKQRGGLTSLDWIAQGAICKNALEKNLDRAHLQALAVLYTDPVDGKLYSDACKKHLTDTLAATGYANEFIYFYTIPKWAGHKRRIATLKWWSVELEKPVSTLADHNRKALTRLRDIEKEAKTAAKNILNDVIESIA